MIIDSKKYNGPCSCGKTHKITTRVAVIEKGCLADIDSYIEAQGLTGRRAAVYDSNTYHAKGLIRPRADQEIILAAEGLQSNEETITRVLAQLKADTAVLIAIGAGTVDDLVSAVAGRLALPYVSCPTAASGDGYAACVYTAVENGVRRTLPGAAPTLMLCDLDVLLHAPGALTRAGIGAALGRFITLADNQAADLLLGRETCPVPEALARQAAVMSQGCAGQMDPITPEAVAQLMYALVLSGLSAQLAGDAAQAHGAAHHLAFLGELKTDDRDKTAALPYGDRIGVWSCVLSDLYHRLAEIEDITPYCRAPRTVTKDWVDKHFGTEHAGEILRENSVDCLRGMKPELLQKHWAQIRRIIGGVPAGDELSAALSQAGCPVPSKAMGFSAAKRERMLTLAPYLSSRFTLLGLTRVLSFRYASSAEPSRAPSRSGRRANKRKAVSASSMR